MTTYFLELQDAKNYGGNVYKDVRKFRHRLPKIFWFLAVTRIRDDRSYGKDYAYIKYFFLSFVKPLSVSHIFVLLVLYHFWFHRQHDVAASFSCPRRSSNDISSTSSDSYTYERKQWRCIFIGDPSGKLFQRTHFIKSTLCPHHIYVSWLGRRFTNLYVSLRSQMQFRGLI